MERVRNERVCSDGRPPRPEKRGVGPASSVTDGFLGAIDAQVDLPLERIEAWHAARSEGRLARQYEFASRAGDRCVVARSASLTGPVFGTDTRADEFG